MGNKNTKSTIFAHIIFLLVQKRERNVYLHKRGGSRLTQKGIFFVDGGCFG
jgi:uncharacterized protein YydD (DUF2326 family)